nr:hypothetical protein [Rhodopirellula sp. SM50]
MTVYTDPCRVAAVARRRNVHATTFISVRHLPTYHNSPTYHNGFAHRLDRRRWARD